MSEGLPAGAIQRRMIGFVGHLRRNDFRVGPGETLAALDLLRRQGAHDATAVRCSLRVLLASRQEEWQRFDELFEAYWFARGRVREHLTNRPETKPRPAGPPAIWRDHLGEAQSRSVAGEESLRQTAATDESAGGGKGRLVASRQEALRRTDLRHIADPEAMAAAERVAYRLARAIRYRLSRRYRIATRGERLDLRRTIRANLSLGGDPLLLATRTRPERPVRLVVLLDVSGSMQPYAHVFLQFVKGLVASWAHADAFLCHTRLVRVTDALRETQGIKAMTRLALMAEGFGGGTRLGPCLRVFNDRYAKARVEQPDGLHRDQRRLRYGAGGGSRGRARPAEAPGAPADLAESAARLGRLRAGQPRHGCGHAVHRSLRRRPQPGRAGGARARAPSAVGPP